MGTQSRLRRKHRKAIKRYGLILAAMVFVAFAVNSCISLDGYGGTPTSSGTP